MYIHKESKWFIFKIIIKPILSHLPASWLQCFVSWDHRRGGADCLHSATRQQRILPTHPALPQISGWVLLVPKSTWKYERLDSDCFLHVHPCPPGLSKLEVGGAPWPAPSQPLPSGWPTSTHLRTSLFLRETGTELAAQAG